MSSTSSLNGLLPIFKPLGLVSKDVSRKLVRKFGKLHIGHVGTLDPAADGVLPVLLGRATRLQDHLLELPKSYDLEMSFGYETDTLDSEGQTINELPFDHVDTAAIERAIPNFLGRIEQIPPLYSAVKLNGKPLYKYARSGKEEDVNPADLKRTVTIKHIDFHGYSNNVAKLSVTCSKGTYIRTLVKDIATSLGTCGTLTRLTRTAAAGIDLPQTVELEAIVNGSEQNLEDYLIPLEKMSFGFPKWKTDGRITARLRNGLETVIERTRFEDGLFEGATNGDNGLVLDTWTKPIILIDENDLVFGLGTVKAGNKDQVIVNMKRGLK